MHTSQTAHVYITVPADCLPLVTELVARLGGVVAHGDVDFRPASSIPAIPRGGKTLRTLRLRAGVTQKALADAVGLPQSHISEFERDKRAVPYKHARKLAEVLHSIPSHFMTPNAETIAAMNGAGKDGRQIYDTQEAMFKDLDI